MISIGLALLLMLGGTAWLIQLLFFTDRFKAIAFVAAGMMAGIGAIWLWSDLSETWSGPKNQV